MKIIVLGAGQAGSDVTRSLVAESNDLTVVDCRTDALRILQERLDIRTVAGHASSPSVLIDAGIEDADLLLAVTSSDETNMIACQVARSLFSTQKCLARVRNPDYLMQPALFSPQAVPVDYLISPEQLVTRHIEHLVAEPGVLQMFEFVAGKARMASVKARADGALAGSSLAQLYQRLPEHPFRIVALFRNDEVIHMDAHTRIEAGDEVFLLAAAQHMTSLLSGLQPGERRFRRVIIAGGGNIGESLARKLERHYHTKLIEVNSKRARHLAEVLEKSIVLLGDAADAELLRQEGVESTDMFCAVTNDDEANILSAMLARRLGVRKTLCLINRSSYVEIAQGSAIDIAVSPAQVTIGALLAHVRRADVLAVHSLHGGAAEALEIKIHGDATTSRVVGRSIEELAQTHHVQIELIARDGQILFPQEQLRLKSADQVVVFVTDKRRIRDIEKLFQVGVTFV